MPAQQQQKKKKTAGGNNKPKPSPSSIAAATANKFAALLLDDEEASGEPEIETREASRSLESPAASNKGEEERGKKGDGEKDVASSASSASAAAAAATGRPSTSTSTTAPSTTRPPPAKTTPPAPVLLRKPLFWLDLEMTGLDPSTDRILEIAVVATDGSDLDVRVAGPSLAISATEEQISRMNAWCVEHHGRSGLAARCLDAARSVPLEEAERLVCEFVERHRPPPREARGARREDNGGGGNDDEENQASSSSSSSGGPPPVRLVQDRATLAGNSIHVDFSFLRAQMPRLAALCSHRLVDVSSLAELARRWHPNAFYCAPLKRNAHEALKDLEDSIDELKYWREVLFRSGHEVTKAVAKTGNARRGG